MHTRIAEIQSYLQHNDHSLAIRRTPDASLDNVDLSLLKEAIRVSRLCRQYKQAALPAVFFDSANNLLSKINNATERFTFQSTTLATASHISKTYSPGNFSLQPISLQISTGNYYRNHGCRSWMNRWPTSISTPGKAFSPICGLWQNRCWIRRRRIVTGVAGRLHWQNLPPVVFVAGALNRLT